MASAQPDRSIHSVIRLIVMLVSGAVAAVIVGLTLGWAYAGPIGWSIACIVFMAWVWLSIARLDDRATQQNANVEDPTTGVAELLILIAAVASLAAVVTLVVVSQNAKGAEKVFVPLLVVASVALSWLLIQTVFTLRYARLYFADPRHPTIDFPKTDNPRYVDFAYVAFTLGMTYQVSDTDLTAFAMRAMALRHALLSYLFGAVILAATVNLVAGLAS